MHQKWPSLNPDTGNSERHCILNECTCEFGQPAVDDCREHNQEQCKPICNDFYSIDQETNICVKNVCYCDHGEPEVEECDQMNTEQCNSCDNFYHQSNFRGYPVCTANVCICADGTPVNPGACMGEGVTQCAACTDDTYFFGLVNILIGQCPKYRDGTFFFLQKIKQGVVVRFSASTSYYPLDDFVISEDKSLSNMRLCHWRSVVFSQ